MDRKAIWCTAALLGIFFISLVAAQQAVPEITPEAAPQFIGKTVSVIGKVTEQKKSSNGNTFLNFCGTYPNQAFSACALASVFENGVPLCEGAVVRVLGKIKI